MLPIYVAETKRCMQIRCFDSSFGRIYDSRQMLGGWSSIIDPIQLADKGSRLAGELPVQGLSRLGEVCRRDVGRVRIDLQFEHDPGDGLRVMHGAIEASVFVACQRCMDEMELTLALSPRLVLLRPGERDDLVEGGNALLVERPITLGTLVEDELLLSMPMVPVHPIEDCRVRDIVEQPALAGDEKKEKKRENPFSALAALKRPDR